MAESGVNVKMGVSGLSQFKNSMKTAQTAVKTLDQQLKTNEAQFKATGDAEAYMEKKTELLELKLKEQKTVVTNAEKALEEMKEKGADPASAAYQKLAQEMLRAKAGMYETEAAMNDVAGAGEDAANEVDSMNQQLKRVGDGVNWQNVTDSLQRISDGIGNVIKRAWQMGEALVKNVLGAGSWADELKTTATQYEDTLLIGQELAPLIEPDADDAKALRFDALMYGIELAYLAGKKYSRARHDLLKKVSAVAGVANIPEIMMQAELIDKILHTDYLDNAGIDEFEHIRESLRDLMKYIPTGKIIYDTDFDDKILSIDWKESELDSDDLKNYKAKAEYYVRQHQDNAVIAKLKSNVPLTGADVKVLEEILWSEVGTRQEYQAEYGEKPLGEFVREIVGLDMNAAKAAFSEYLDETHLDSRQIYFVNQIVEYIVHNGMMKDLSVLQEPPFTDQGSIVEVFTDLTVWMGIRRVIEQVNANALAA